MTPDKFIAELMQVFKLDAPAPEDFIRILRRELNTFTGYQLAKGCDEIRRTRRYRNFPTIAETLDAVKAQPREEFRPDAVPAARSVHTAPPILRWAERYLADYDRASPAERKALDRQYRGRAEAARAVVKAWDPMNVPVQRSPEEKEAFIRRLLGHAPEPQAQAAE